MIDDLEPDTDVDVLVGTRTVAGTIEQIETEPTIGGLEAKVHVAISSSDSTIVCSPGQLRPA